VEDFLSCVKTFYTSGECFRRWAKTFEDRCKGWLFIARHSDDSLPAAWPLLPENPNANRHLPSFIIVSLLKLQYNEATIRIVEFGSEL
jgi:hypothetical protein